ncbi:MAG: peptidase M1 [Myxococcales bacterium]|nr:peptidase M1 [Myxococcales bacterium]
MLDASERSASFEVKGLTINAVRDDAGAALPFSVVDGRLDVLLAPGGGAKTFSVDYAFHQQSKLDGLLPGGSTLVWPYHCGNLFPCKSDPSDGLTFELSVRNPPDGTKSIYPSSIAYDAPSYQIAWATGSYSEKVLGTSKGGTTLHVYWLPIDNANAVDAGTARLVQVFDWLESTLGPYLFGSDAGSISTNWGPGAVGGMEHHPFWHIGSASMGDKTVHAHEAAHGWFGDGVRLQCWEDFVLSEGTVTYLTARAIGAVEGESAEAAVWASNEIQLKQAVAKKDHIAWPKDAGCNKVDVLASLFTNIPYLKGAYFYRAVAQAVGADRLDKVLRLFFETYRGKAARMQQMLDLIRSETGFDAGELAKTWLESTGLP